MNTKTHKKFGGQVDRIKSKLTDNKRFPKRAWLRDQIQIIYGTAKAEDFNFVHWLPTRSTIALRGQIVPEMGVMAVT